jgi:hypothetical protein
MSERDELATRRCTPDSSVAGAVQLDLSRGVLAAVPGWAHVRLLAPHADLRLLVCGHSSLVDSHRLRWAAASTATPASCAHCCACKA